MTERQFAFGAALNATTDRVKTAAVSERALKVDGNGRILPSVEAAVGVAATATSTLDDLVLPLPPAWRVNDQGPHRGTCNAFAALSMYHLLRFWAGETLPDLSEEYLYAKMRGSFGLTDTTGIHGYNAGATVLEQAADALTHAGACLETELPYAWNETDPAYTHPDADDHDPSAAQRLITDATVFGIFLPDTAARPLDGLSRALHLILSQGLPVVISVPIFPYGSTTLWEIGAGWRTGVIPDPQWEPGEKPDPLGGHSVCLVGYQADPTDPSHGWFLFRNSWGRRFGRDAKATHGTRPAVPDAGYGALSTRHVDEHVWDVMFPVLNNV